MFEHVVVGVTDSPASAHAVEAAMGMAKESGGTLHLVSAFGARRPEAPSMPEEFRYSIGSVDPVDWRLTQFEAEARRADVTVMTHAVLADPIEALTRVARQEAADLIVVGVEASNGGRHRPRVTDGLLREAACAVLVVEPDPSGDSPSR
jgi:nucleotide-binding universal stress UspA family protein